MNELMMKLSYIKVECMDPDEKKKIKEADKAMDNFTRQRKEMARDVKQLRQQIQERNELLGSAGDGTRATVEASARIRRMIQDITTQAGNLEKMQKEQEEELERKKAEGKTIKEEDQNQVAHRKEVVELCYKHIKELKFLEKHGEGGHQAEFIGSFGGKEQTPLVTELPDIDGDEAFMLLKRQDLQIAAFINKASEGIEHLRILALAMGNELEMQDMMLATIEVKVDKTTEHLARLNRDLKKALQGVRRGNRLCIDMILLVVILGIAGYIYNMLST
eukprot:TRINITY_DN620_c0_g2_i1.p1 TRINITY_DN620_c0_g2~~TRINITY_DN620_c0_g2_i1.p1  ORF type:complete len:276 (+),score=78.57 TRINITY_DN620_c0_g2_i1:60-887(+)